MGAPFAGPDKGRALQLKRGTASSEVLIAGVRSKSMSINGEPIDVTNDDDAGWKKLLDGPGEISVEISVSGVAKDHTLLEESLDSSDRVQSTVFAWTGGDKLSGSFYLQSYKESGDYKDGIMFEATFASTGTVTFTEGA